MKTIRTFVFPLLAAAFMAGNFTACTQESPLEAGNSAATLSKGRLRATEDNLTGTTEKGSMTYLAIPRNGTPIRVVRLSCPKAPNSNYSTVH